MLREGLAAEHFLCDEAEDGLEAKAYMQLSEFDALIIDLLMPNQGGHQLASEILERPRRPFVVIHSCTEEARLIKDLVLRGADDILFKPANYWLWAAKLRSQLILTERHRYVDSQFAMQSS
jgi:DNA-binding response OmpR family regulator